MILFIHFPLSPPFRKRTKSLDDISGLRFSGEAMSRSDGSFQSGADIASDAAFDYRLFDDAAFLPRDEDHDDESGRRYDQNLPRLTSELGLLSRPNPPTALIIRPLTMRNGLNISWSPSIDSPSSNTSLSAIPASFYIVEYRSKDSIGWEENKPLVWSALADRIVGRRWTLIHDVRPGFRYEFRVFAFSALNSFRCERVGLKGIVGRLGFLYVLKESRRMVVF